MPSGIGITGRGTRPYRKYRPLPALLLIGLLGAVSVYVWLRAIESDTDIDEAVRCDPPASPPPEVTYTPVGHDALDEVTPIPPDKVSVQVLNASDRRNQANFTTDRLLQLGFTKVADPGNDPAYEGRTADCHGQIRFGTNGEAAARTLSLIDGCIELVKDSREDASVDLVIGSKFVDVLPRTEAREILAELTAWAEEHDSNGSSELSADDGPRLDPDRLANARSKTC